MQFGMQHGVPGIEGQHIFNDLVTFNTPTVPRMKLDKITGLHDLPEIDDTREQNYGRAGEQVYPVNTRGRTITYEGRLQAISILQLRQLTQDLKIAGTGARSSGLATME